MYRNPTKAKATRFVDILKPVFFTAIIIASALAPAVSRASSTGPKILVSGKAVTSAVPAYLDSDDNLYASVDFVKAMGAGYRAATSGKSVSVSLNGRTTVWPCEMKSGQAVVAVQGLAEELGGVYRWNDKSQTATILARIRMVREDSDELSVVTSFPTACHVDAVDKPNRVYIDVFGASLGSAETDIPVSGDDVGSVRANQMSADTVRVVIDLKQVMSYRVATAPEQNRVDVSLVSGPPVSGATISVASATAHLGARMRVVSDDSSSSQNSSASDDNSDESASPSDDSGQSLSRPDAIQHISNISVDSSIPDHLQLIVTVAGPQAQSAPPYRTFLLDSPSRLALDLPGADFALTGDLAANSNCALPLQSATVKQARWGIVKPSDSLVGRVVLDLNKVVHYTVASKNLDDGTVQYTLTVMSGDAPALPTPDTQLATVPATPTDGSAPNPQPQITQPENVPDSVLSGKTIVVDPGHGGHDGGAPGANGLWEKSVVLAIGTQLRDMLAACGAKVVMTRADDTFIPLPTRSQMGIDNHADYFVSVHADSSGASNSHNGATVYYHANLSNCRAMASSIANRLSQLDDGIRSLGVRSDYVRFPGVGFSVLRRSPEAAVLVETGYVNSDHDASILTNPAMQKLIAQGIVAGLKDFAAQTAKIARRAAPVTAGKPAELALTDTDSSMKTGDEE